MRVCIVGAGAIGGLIGARVAAAGHRVSVLARGDNLAAIRANGFRLIEPDGAVVEARDVRAAATMSELGPQDHVFLALKAHQIAALAADLPALFDDDTVVIPLQNGLPWWFFQKFPGPYEGHRVEALDPDGVLAEHIPADRIVASIAYPAAEREAPGVIRLIEGDRFPIGELDGQRSERATAIAAMLSDAGFKSRVVTDIRSELWIKAWGNMAFNPISALTGATLAGITRFAPTRDLAAQMMAESAAVAEKIGLRLRISIDQRIAGAEKVGEHKTSMLQDVEAGRPLEIEPLIGAFVELGRLTGTPMPATETVYALVSLLDQRLSAR